VGGTHLKEHFGNDALAVFIMPPSVEELEHRLRLRSTDSDEAIAMRVAKARSEMQFADKFDIIIINDQLEKAVEETIASVKQFLEN